MSAFGGVGRPPKHETRARTQELLRLLTGGKPLAVAAREAGVKPDRVLRLLDEPEFFAVYAACRDGEEIARSAA